jgi:hypothetical protein
MHVQRRGRISEYRRWLESQLKVVNTMIWTIAYIVESTIRIRQEEWMAASAGLAQAQAYHQKQLDGPQ